MSPKATRSYLSIGEVLSLLRVDFPDVTISKIRFLESQGLVTPERTSSGYRKFHEPDVERLRFVLRAQREHFLPLKVIRERMEEAGLAPSEPTKPPGARRRSVSELVAALQEPPSATTRAPGDEPGAPGETPETTMSAAKAPAAPGVAGGADDPLDARTTAATHSAEELAAAAGIDAASVAALVDAGLIVPASAGGVDSYDEDAVAIAKASAGFFEMGLEPRHLKILRHGVDREIGMIESLVLPLLQQRTPEGRVRAREQATQFARLGQTLRAALLRRELRRMLG